MSDTDRLRTGIIALQKATVPEGVYGSELDAVLAAARRFLALTETGPDYEAAAKRLYLFGAGDERGWQTINRVDDPVFNALVADYNERAKAIVDAALADYLTEGET